MKIATLLAAALLTLASCDRYDPVDPAAVGDPVEPPVVNELAVPAALTNASPQPAAEKMSLDAAISICRTVFFIDNAKGKAMFDALPEADKPMVAALCIAYRSGAEDLVAASQQRRENRS